MINTLDHWIRNSVPRGEPFLTPEGLTCKVDPDGHILPFRGITVIFRLKPEVIGHLTELQDQLYDACGYMLADRLDPASFHMTLHDIAAAPPCEQIEIDIQYYRPRLLDSLSQLRSSLAVFASTVTDKIPVHGTHVFNMCHTSIVLGVDSPRPYDDLLCALHSHFNLVCDTDDAWTPHITLAYFKPRGYYEYDGVDPCKGPTEGRWVSEPYSEEELTPLRQILTKDPFAFQLHLCDLEIQTFTDMNHYKTVV